MLRDTGKAKQDTLLSQSRVEAVLAMFLARFMSSYWCLLLRKEICVLQDLSVFMPAVSLPGYA